MINKISICLIAAFGVAINTNAQIGVGTTTPNSTLDVRGSLSTAYRAFSASTSAAITDNILTFTGTSAATLTLPNATACSGRVYWIKSTSSNASVLTVATTSSQTIDGLASWTVTQTNKVLALVSNGANWLVTSENVPGSGGGTAWALGGNNISGAAQNIGTTSNFDLPFITNNTEKMRLSSAGNLEIGALAFNATNPEKLLVDAGVTSSVNAIVGKGTINSYLQLNIQNLSNGTSASSDVVATADNCSETTNFVDMGINSSTNTSGVMGAANDAYLYNVGQNFLIGTGTAAKSLAFLTGGTTQSSNERMRIDGNGLVGIGVNNPASLLEVGSASTGATAAIATRTATSVSSFTAANYANYNGGVIQSTYPGGVTGHILNVVAAGSNSGNWPSNIALWTRNSGGTNASEKVRISDAGNVGIGTSSFNATYPEKLVVDAGTTSSVNAIVGKGSINSYLQLNIQNQSSGTSASSDVVATADNGSETTNFVDMGINSSTNASGVMGAANDAYLYNIGQNFLLGTGTASKSLVFMTGGTSQGTNERMRIDGNGSVGIGTNAPAQKFHLNGGNMRITNGGISADFMVGTTFAGITNASGIVYYEVAGTETHMFGGDVIPDADNSRTNGSSARRWSAVYAANGTIQTSDVRLKKNIHELPYGLAEVLRMKPVAYNWKDNTGGNKIGLIAQEVRKIIPEVVLGDEAKENLGMNYAEMVPVLINAIKEQQVQIDALKKEIQALKK